MDIVMPGLNGFQATRTLSRDPKTSSIPIVMVTTKNLESDRVWGYAAGSGWTILSNPSMGLTSLLKANELLQHPGEPDA